MIEDGPPQPVLGAAFELMLAEVASPSLGTQAFATGAVRLCSKRCTILASPARFWP